MGQIRNCSGWRFGWQVALILVLSFCVISPPLAAAQSVRDYFQISYNPVIFSETEIHGSEIFYATIQGNATCTQAFPVSVSEAIMTFRVIAEHKETGSQQIINSRYTIKIKPFPNKEGQSYEINKNIPLKFPKASQSGDYTVIGELIKAKVKAYRIIWKDVTSYLPQSQEMGSVNYITKGIDKSPRKWGW